MVESHQRARWSETGGIETIGYAPAAPGPGEIQVRVESCGICGTDLHFWRGEVPTTAGLTPGHEFAGRVAAVGAGVKRVREGDRVGVEPIVRCNACRFCRTGDYHVCADSSLIGVARNGGMSECVNVPAFTAFPVPDALDGELGALAEPLAVAVHGLRKARLSGHDTAVIIGAGSIGLTALLAANAYGAHTIIVARHPHQQAAARALGADEVIGDDDAGRARLKVLRKSRAVDVAVETVGGQGDTLMQAQLLLRPKGRLLLLGVFVPPTVPIAPMHLALNEIELVGAMTYAASDGVADYRIALDILADRTAAARGLITHRFGLESAGEAFATAADKSTGSIKVQVQP